MAALAPASLSACGGDGSASSKTTPPTTAQKPKASPLDKAPGLVKAAVGAPYAVWMARYAEKWGEAPSQTWGVEKQADDQWMARLALSAKGHQKVAEWRIALPLDRPPTAAELKDANVTNGEAVVPANAMARRLARYPLPARGTDDVRLTAVASGDQGSKLMITATLADAAGAAVHKSGRIDDPALRAARLFTADDVMIDGTLRTHGVKLLDHDGKRLSRGRLSKRVEHAGPQPIVVVWHHVPKQATFKQLLRKAPASIRLTTDPEAGVTAATTP